MISIGQQQTCSMGSSVGDLFFFDGVTGKEKHGDDGFVNGYVSNLDVIISLVTK